jgi:hypothetical protein
VVCGWLCLVLTAARGLCGMHCAGAICLLVDAAIIIGGGLLVALLVPLLSGFGTLLSTLDGDAAASFYDAFGGIGRRMKRW